MPLSSDDDQSHSRSRELYLDTLRDRYAAMTPRQRRRLHRRYPILEICLRHLVDDGLLQSSSAATDHDHQEDRPS